MGPRLLLVPLVLGLLACGPSRNPEPVATNQVTMAKSYKFEPAIIRVPVGATVTWSNQDNFTHDVHLVAGAEWKSEPLAPGSSISRTFDAAGEYSYECAFHPQNMKGKVIAGQ